MDQDHSFESAAEHIVAWAARNPLSAAEAERRYGHLLAGLPPIPAPQAEWARFSLGRLAVRFWKDRVEEMRQSLDAISLGTAAPAFRGGPPPSAPAGAERLLRAAGKSGSAWVKITENPDHATVALALWIEPASGSAPAPFAVTVFGAGDAVVAGPVECSDRSVLKFASVAPAGTYTLVFKTADESWRIQWEILPAPA